MITVAAHLIGVLNTLTRLLACWAGQETGLQVGPVVRDQEELARQRASVGPVRLGRQCSSEDWTVLPVAGRAGEPRQAARPTALHLHLQPGVPGQLGDVRTLHLPSDTDTDIGSLITL